MPAFSSLDDIETHRVSLLVGAEKCTFVLVGIANGVHAVPPNVCGRHCVKLVLRSRSGARSKSRAALKFDDCKGPSQMQWNVALPITPTRGVLVAMVKGAGVEQLLWRHAKTVAPFILAFDRVPEWPSRYHGSSWLALCQAPPTKSNDLHTCLLIYLVRHGANKQCLLLARTGQQAAHITSIGTEIRAWFQ